MKFSDIESQNILFYDAKEKKKYYFEKELENEKENFILYTTCWTKGRIKEKTPLFKKTKDKKYEFYVNDDKKAILEQSNILKVNGAEWVISQLFPLEEAIIFSGSKEIAQIYKTQHIDWGDVYVIDFSEKEREPLLVMYIYMLLKNKSN